MKEQGQQTDSMCQQRHGCDLTLCMHMPLSTTGVISLSVLMLVYISASNSHMAMVLSPTCKAHHTAGDTAQRSNNQHRQTMIFLSPRCMQHVRDSFEDANMSWMMCVGLLRVCP